MAAALIFCLIFLFLPLSKQLSTQDALTVVLHSIEQLVDFYQSDYRNLNIDGLFGLRVLEGHLDAILQKHGRGKLSHLTPEVVSSIKSMKQKTSATCNSAIGEVERDDPNYFRVMKYVVGSPWSIFDPQRRRVNMDHAWSPITYKHAKNTVNLDERTSDLCMSELIGSHKPNARSCDISNECIHTMTAPGLLGYGITHQLLWTMLADKTGCKLQLERKLTEIRRGSLTTLKLELCTNNYIQMVQMLDKFRNSVIVPSLQDLFLEQLMICPSLGFFEFLQLDFLPDIVSWQHKTGCFGKMAKPPSTEGLKGLDMKNLAGRFRDDYIDNQVMGAKPNKNYLKEMRLDKTHNDMPVGKNGHPGILMAPNYEHIKSPQNVGRKLLVEKDMTGGCLAHKTAVGSGALVIYLRYLCEPDAEKIFSLAGNESEHQTKLGGPRELGKPANIFDSLVKERGTHDKEVLKVKQNDGIQELHDNLLRNDAVLDNTLNIQNNAGVNKNVVDEQKVPGINDNYKMKHYETHQLQAPAPGMAAYDNNELVANNHNDDDDGYDDEEEDEEEEDNVTDDYHIGNKGRLGGDPVYHYQDQGHRQHHQLINGNNDDDEDDDEYADANDDDDDDDDDDEGDDNNDYGYDIPNNDLVQGHINARNIGHGKGNYDDGYDNREEKSLGHVKDYKYDDEEEEDDYEYDDDNDEMERRRKEEIKEELNRINTLKNSKSASDSSKHLHISETEGFTRTATIMLTICIFIVILLVYRLIRKRRIRIRLHNKYFNV